MACMQEVANSPMAPQTTRHLFFALEQGWENPFEIPEQGLGNHEVVYLSNRVRA